MAILSETAWARHANPWSGWTRVLTMPALAIGLYTHSALIILIAILWAIINPTFFSRPKSVDNWMSKGVLGEEIYYKDGKKIKYDLPTLLNILNIAAFAAFLYFGWEKDLVGLVLSGILVMTIKFWFVDRMVALYETQGHRAQS